MFDSKKDPLSMKIKFGLIPLIAVCLCGAANASSIGAMDSITSGVPSVSNPVQSIQNTAPVLDLGENNEFGGVIVSPSVRAVLLKAYDKLMAPKIKEQDNKILAMQQKINALNGKIYPIGYIYMSVSSDSPSGSGIVGNWQRISNDTTVISTNNPAKLGSVTGKNVVPVPLPKHDHFGRTSDHVLSDVFTTSINTHSHQISSMGGPGLSYGMLRGGDGSGLYGWIRNLGGVHNTATSSHSHSVYVNFGSHSHLISAQGVDNALLDVTGRRLNVYMWKRVS